MNLHEVLISFGYKKINDAIYTGPSEVDITREDLKSSRDIKDVVNFLIRDAKSKAIQNFKSQVKQLFWTNEE